MDAVRLWLRLEPPSFYKTHAKAKMSNEQVTDQVTEQAADGGVQLTQEVEAVETAKAEKVKKQPVRHEEFADCFYMTKDGEPDAVVNENSLATMEEQGWKLKLAKAK
jgi:metal-dependent hydrolase (beta-lactamase superfamily II)